jgi:hypothetical protein
LKTVKSESEQGGGKQWISSTKVAPLNVTKDDSLRDVEGLVMA